MTSSSKSFFDDTEDLWCDFYEMNSAQKSAPSAVCGGKSGAATLLDEMFSVMIGKPGLTLNRSKKNWRRTRETCIGDGNKRPEICLEKSVAMLADNSHMLHGEWYNQVPVASGLIDRYSDGRAAVDLVQWDEKESRLHLIELKIASNDPPYALYEILKYGMSYIYFRREKVARELITLRPREVVLEVLAPREYFAQHDQRDLLAQLNAALPPFAARIIGKHAPHMRVDVCAFPPDFKVPFADGAEVKNQCAQSNLTAQAKTVRDAFAARESVWAE